MDDPRKSDASVFPDPVYKDTVLAPLFEGARDHHVEGFRAIDRAHLVMLAEQGIIDAQTARTIAGALKAIDAEVDVPALVYTGEVEDFFFLIEKQLKSRIGVEVASSSRQSSARSSLAASSITGSWTASGTRTAAGRCCVRRWPRC